MKQISAHESILKVSTMLPKDETIVANILKCLYVENYLVPSVSWMAHHGWAVRRECGSHMAGKRHFPIIFGSPRVFQK